MYLSKTACVHGRYEQFPESRGIVCVRNAEHGFLSVEQPTCSVDGGGFGFVVVVAVLAGFLLVQQGGHLLFPFHVFRSSGGGESILKHDKNLIFSLKKAKEN